MYEAKNIRWQWPGMDRYAFKILLMSMSPRRWDVIDATASHNLGVRPEMSPTTQAAVARGMPERFQANSSSFHWACEYESKLACANVLKGWTTSVGGADRV